MLYTNIPEHSTIVVDVDDVLFYTTALWYRRIVERFNDSSNKERYDNFRRLLNHDTVLNNFQYYENKKHFMFVYSRDKFYLSDWMLKKELTKKEINKGKEIIFETFNQPNFYLSPSLAQTPLLFSIKNIIASPNFKLEKAIILTRTTKETEESKIKLLNFHFNNLLDKVDLITVDLGEKKSDVVNEYISKGANISMIIDDELSNVYDYIDHCRIDHSQIVIPKYGYNIDFSEKYFKKAREYSIDVTYFGR